ncbi:hypothetical protein [Chitinilyticum litopenaei]|uniref:hypothetical protein n=1 Tax=Chitinilyticum litopenaei TaxID=1121276 RepID=UPI0003FDCA3E|nr:hypothetical protein [Chitinilyticum litopenaei]
MSLISRLEVTNYLTEGISAHRRAADWKPMLTGITLRMDGGKSALVNITNGGGKTSLVELHLYLLSRDARLLKQIREKVAPKSRGYTHARIEFWSPPEDNFVAPSLLEIDPQNLLGETHVIGVALNDDANEQPIFYSYSGRLEDSPCYIYDGKTIASVPDSEFVARTKALRGCKWNKFTSRREWEDHIRLFLPVEVIRRNVVYQLKGSDDKNASFFQFTPRPGESFDGAFFRSVVAPDLLSNLLSSFSEEDESAVEDTLLKSLTRIVDAEREIVRKERRLKIRETGIEQLRPIMEAGAAAQALKGQRDAVLRSLRKDITFLRHFGAQEGPCAMPGIPRRIPNLREQDPRILVALKGMVITRDDGILLLDKALSELSGIDVSKINEVANRKSHLTPTPRKQVIDLTCDFGFSSSGVAGGGHYRKGYPKDSALAMPDDIAGISGAKIAGLKEVLACAFDLAEKQIDTNPAAQRVRQLQASATQQKESQATALNQVVGLQESIKQLDLQIKDRQENQGAWEDFVKIGHLLPDEHRSEPNSAKNWISGQQFTLQITIAERNVRRGRLAAAWETYTAVLEHHGLEGLEGAKARYGHLKTQKAHIREESTRIGKAIAEAGKLHTQLRNQHHPLSAQCAQANSQLAKFDQHAQGLALYGRLFGSTDPTTVDPLQDLSKASTTVQKKQLEIQILNEESSELASLKSQAYLFAGLFGDGADPINCDPQGELAVANINLIAARESMAVLRASKEAIEQFQDAHPDIRPADWLATADENRGRLTLSQQELARRESELCKELQALEQMRSVEDGAFEQAWAILDAGGLSVQRLHQVVLEEDLELNLRNDILSALSGMLSAPVFDTLEDLKLAAGTLQAASVAVPLILRSELFRSIEQGVSCDGDTRLIGFIGGNTSRRVHILLDAEFAAAEHTRIQEELVEIQGQIKEVIEALSKLNPSGQNYQLAMRAKEAADHRARERYLDIEGDAHRLEMQINRLMTQNTPQALEVLGCARAFITKGGDARLEAISEILPPLEAELGTLFEAEGKAKERASQQALNARDDARAYQRLGGLAEHEIIRNLSAKLTGELEGLDSEIAEAAVTLGNLGDQQAEIARQTQAFEDEGGSSELARHEVAIGFAGNADNLDFMSTFAVVQDAINDDLKRLIDASRVNFERASSFKANQDKSDQALQAEIDQKHREVERLNDIASKAGSEWRRIIDAEIPAWSRLAKSIHELAYEVGSRVARTRSIAEQARELEEGDAIPEVHSSFGTMHALIQCLHGAQLEAYGRQVDEVDRVAQAIQEMNLEDAIKEHKEIASQYAAALRKYTDLNASFCAAADDPADSSATAFNTLEIDEIRKATPETMTALMSLFEQLQASLNKERGEAQQAKRVAEETSEDTLAQLTQLIVSAEDNLSILNKVMKKYPNGRFHFQTQINKDETVFDLINDLKDEVELATRETDSKSRSIRRTDETQLKRLLRDKLIQCVFTNTSVEFVNAGIWGGKKSHVSEKLSTGQKIALEFMWIVRQAEYEIERGLLEMTSTQAAKSRSKANRVILIDGIFSTLSDRKIIGEALNGLRDLGGNFQILGFLHSPTWTNDYTVFPVYHVGKKLTNNAGDGLVSFMEHGREAGTVGFFSSITRTSTVEVSGA